MKRKSLSIVLCLLLLLAVVFPASADTLPKVVDNADLLTDSEESALEEKAAALWDDCQLDVVVVTVNSLGGKSVQTYADDYYDEHGYGYGSDYSGILLLLAMETREWYISTCGEANYIFTDYGLEQMGSTMLPYLSGGDYYGAFDIWLEDIPRYCDAYRQGSPVDGYAPPDSYYPEGGDEIVYYGQKEMSPVGRFLIALLIGVVAALVAVLVMRSKMNTATYQKNAVNYIKKNSYYLGLHRDMYLYSRVTKTPKPQNNGGGSRGGSSVHRSSGGRSHGGRGGRF